MPTYRNPYHMYDRLIHDFGKVQEAVWQSEFLWTHSSGKWCTYWVRNLYENWDMQEQAWDPILRLIRRKTRERFVAELWTRYVDVSKLREIKKQLWERKGQRSDWCLSYQFRNTAVARKGCCLTGMHILKPEGEKGLQIHFDTSVQEILGLLPGDLWLFDAIIKEMEIQSYGYELNFVVHTSMKWWWYEDTLFALFPLIGLDSMSNYIYERAQKALEKGPTHNRKRMKRFSTMSQELQDELDQAGEKSILPYPSFGHSR